MADSMFLYPRDLVTIHDNECSISKVRRSHVVGREEVNGIAVVSDFHAFLGKADFRPKAISTVSMDIPGLPNDVLMEDSNDREFYVDCLAEKIQPLLIDWSEQWRKANGYSPLPAEARSS